MDYFKKKYSIFLLLILLLSAAVRFAFLQKIPVSLYSDEIDQGYNAYSILKTGRDEHGIFLPVSLRSFGDWKPPLQTYLMIPFVYLFGLNATAVRLPGVLMGIGCTVLVFSISKKIFHSNKISLLSAFFLSISPWHILQSRSAMLVMIALFFLMLSIYFFLKSLEKKIYYIFTSVAFVFSVYAYYGMRVITPLIIIVLFFLYMNKIIKAYKVVAISILTGIIFMIPLFVSFTHEPNVVFGRAKTVSVFYDQGVKLRQWELITQDGINFPTNLSRLFHNNIYMYGKNILQRYFSHFDGKFLFLKGDQSPPFTIPDMGILYLADAFFILPGLFIAVKDINTGKKLILLILAISIIPAAFTFMTPSSNRTFNAVIPFSIFTALGISVILKLSNKSYFLPVIISLIYILSFAFFLKQYFIVTPKSYADVWNFGWENLVYYLNGHENKYEQVMIADIGMPYSYILFYKQIDPNFYQKRSVRSYRPGEFGFEHVENFDKYYFLTDFNWKYIKEDLKPKTLYVVPAGQTVPSDKNLIYEIKYPDGKIAYKLFGYE